MDWVIAGLLLCILFAILRLTEHIKQESFWIKDHLKLLTPIKENTFEIKDELKHIQVDTDIILKKMNR